MNNKGVSLISLAITIIVIIILAAISIMSSTKSIEQANKVKFQDELKSVVEALETYKQRAYIYGVPDYDSNEMTWDGKSEKAENTAKIEDGVNEDTVRFIFNTNQLPNSVKDVITIESGLIKVDNKNNQKYEWATEMYGYME